MQPLCFVGKKGPSIQMPQVRLLQLLYFLHNVAAESSNDLQRYSSSIKSDCDIVDLPMESFCPNLRAPFLFQLLVLTVMTVPEIFD